MAETLYASFADCHLAERAVGALMDFGVKGEDISLVSHESHSRATDGKKDDDPVEAGKHGLSTTTAGDAGAGAAKGAGVGLGVGVVAALASIFVPGFGLVMGGGALAAALAGMLGTTVGGAIAGGITGYLKDQGVPDEAAVNYEEAVKRGGAMIAVHVPSGKVDNATIHEILAKYHAANVGTYGAGVPSTGYAPPASTTYGGGFETVDSEDTIETDATAGRHSR